MRVERLFPEWGQQNILNLSEELRFYSNCHVESHTRHHSILTIKVVFLKEGTPPLKLRFIQPTWYKGSLQWRNTNLSVARNEEVVEYLKRDGKTQEQAERIA